LKRSILLGGDTSQHVFTTEVMYLLFLIAFEGDGRVKIRVKRTLLRYLSNGSKIDEQRETHFLQHQYLIHSIDVLKINEQKWDDTPRLCIMTVSYCIITTNKTAFELFYPQLMRFMKYQSDEVWMRDVVCKITQTILNIGRAKGPCNQFIGHLLQNLSPANEDMIWEYVFEMEAHLSPETIQTLKDISSYSSRDFHRLMATTVLKAFVKPNHKAVDQDQSSDANRLDSLRSIEDGIAHSLKRRRI
jgi:hypothetical protein